MPSSIQNPTNDVAISFLARDEATGTALCDLLGAGLNVFFFPRNQEELAGTEGLESMRTPFYDGSRVVVILYREPWGQTNWTRVEETAIKDRCLQFGWDSLLFIVLDKRNIIPTWLPQTHIRFHLEDYGLEQAAGAIKLKVQEKGGNVTPVTALQRAAQVQAESDFLDYRSRYLGSHQGVIDFCEEAAEVMRETGRLAQAAGAAAGFSIEVGFNAGRCVLKNDLAGLAVEWHPSGLPSLEGATLSVVEYDCPIARPNERAWYFPGDEPRQVVRTQFVPALSRVRERRWTSDNAQKLLSTPELADWSVQRFFDLTLRMKRQPRTRGPRMH